VGSAFPDWKRYAVRQRRALSGCVPTGYEILLRAAGVEGIDLDSFQDDFDLDQDLVMGMQPRNNFESVADAVRAKYPRLNFRRLGFKTGSEKLAFVEARIAQQQPVLVSLSLAGVQAGGGGWHIMPVVDASDDDLTLLNRILPDGRREVLRVPKSEFVRIHDTYPGGDDVAYLEVPTESSFMPTRR
jgi:hypothetical protein